MRVVSCFLLALVVGTGSAFGDTLGVSIKTDKSSYAAGETISYELWATASDIQGTNLGVGTIGTNVVGVAGQSFSAAVISPAFADYSFVFPGTLGQDGQLPNVGAGLLAYNAAAVELGESSRGPTLLASGTVNALGIGDYTLRVVPQAGQFYTSTGGAQSAYSTLNGGTAAYSVVPEPSSLMLGLLGSVVAAGYTLRRRRAAKKAQATA